MAKVPAKKPKLPVLDPKKALVIDPEKLVPLPPLATTKATPKPKKKLAAPPPRVKAAHKAMREGKATFVCGKCGYAYVPPRIVTNAAMHNCPKTKSLEPLELAF